MYYNEKPELSFSNVDWNQVHAVVKEAQAERARMIARTLSAAFRAVGRMIGNVVDAIFEASASARLYTELSRMSDRQLADIGLTREELPSFVAAQRPALRAEVKAGHVVAMPAKAQRSVAKEIKRAA